MSEEKERFKYALLVSWHTQFAENQRIREQSFLKILGFLGFVILGYTIVYQNYPQELHLVAVSASTLLFFGAWQITTIAYNFRRDQFVNMQIRSEADIIGENKLFPSSYNPYKTLIEVNSKRYYSWLPDFLQPYYYIFPVFQILLLISFCYRGQEHFINMYFSLIVSIIVIVISIFLTLLLPLKYYIKINNKYTNFDCKYK